MTTSSRQSQPGSPTTSQDICDPTLSSVGIYLNEVIGAFVCKPCGTVLDISKPILFRRHLREKHNIAITPASVLCTVASTQISQNTKLYPLRSEYYSGTTTVGRTLTAIQGLPQRQGQQCNDCLRVFTAGSGFINHRRRVHGDREPKILQNSTPIVPCQSLRSKPSDIRLYILNSDEPTVNTVPSTVAEKFLRLTSKRGRDEASSEPEQLQDWARSTFVSMTKAPERLKSLGLSVADAASLCSAQLREDTTIIKSCLLHIPKALMLMFREAQAIACDFNKPYYVRTDLSTPGLYTKSRRFYFLKTDEQGDQSIIKYANRSRVPVTIAVRSWCEKDKYPSIHMNPDFEDSVRNYVEYCQRFCNEIDPANDEYQKLLHSLLFQLFFEDEQEKFCSVVHACLCTCWDTSRAKKARGSARAELTNAAVYSNASKTGHTLAGIMYSVTCVAILKAYKYNGERTQREIHTSLRESLLPGSPLAYTTLVDLRSLCTTLRPFEVVRTEFTPCTDKSHGLCGFTKQIELSTIEIGRYILRMQDMARTLMFNSLLLGSPLPPDYEHGIDALVDNFDNNAVGYSAINSHENEVFVQSCDIWMYGLMREHEEHFKSITWQKNAQRLLQLFLALIHLSSGSPGRGTELASYHVTNTRATKRNIYFTKGEVMFMPHYDKRRAVLCGKLQFITRHTDKETSYLFKSYLLLVHRAHQFFLNDEQMNTNQRYAVDHLLTLGLIPRKRVSSAITSALKTCGFPMDLQTYRHHQTGLLKERCQRENLSTVWLHLFGSNDREIPSDEEVADVDTLDPVQECGLEQAAHSVRTAFEKYAQYSSKNGHISLQKVQTRIELNRKAAKAWHNDCGLLKKSDTTSAVCKNSKDVAQLRNGSPADIHSSAIDEIECVPKEIAQNTPFVPGKSLNGSACAEQRDDSDFPSVHSLPQLTTVFNMPINTRDPTHSCFAFQNGFNPERGLQRAIAIDASWKSPEQRLAMMLVAENKQDVLVSIKTGGGKSATVLGPILFESGFTIWISPLRSLRLETSLWMSRCKINIYDLESVNLQRWTELGNVILLSPEVIGSALFQSVRKRLLEQKLLNRVVIDEAHLVLTMQWFRPCMMRIGAASNWGTSCNVVLLTATAPPIILPQIAKLCGVDAESLKIVRGDPRRRNLKIVVKRVQRKSLRETIKVLTILSCRNIKGSRCIVYCLSVVFVEELFLYLSKDQYLREKVVLLKYHGQLSTDESNSSMESWRQKVPPNKSLFMIATDAFGCGIDVPDVRQVIIAGGCRSLVELWQQGGRAGRDGNKATVTVVYDPIACNAVEHVVGAEYFLRANCGDFKSWCNDLRLCRRLKIESTIMGCDVKHLKPCSLDPDAERCDNCETNGSACAEEAFYSGYPEQIADSFNANSSAYVRQIRHAQLEIWASGVQWLHETSSFLEGRCLYCLLSKSQSPEYNSFERSELTKVLISSMSCTSKCCKFRYCYRCRQSNHVTAKNCKYLQSYFNSSCQSPASKLFRCGSCFVGTIGGRDVHRGQFAHHCPVKNCSSFCLTAFSIPQIRRVILSDSSPYGQALAKGLYQQVQDVYERYITWLTEDTPDHDAGLLVMTQYLFRNLSLEKLKEYV